MSWRSALLQNWKQKTYRNKEAGGVDGTFLRSHICERGVNFLSQLRGPDCDRGFEKQLQATGQDRLVSCK
jgi:hypothetical protein